MTGYNLAAGRDPDQIKKMQDLIASGVCAFCPEHFAEFHDNPVAFSTPHWLVTANDYPYSGTRLHLLVVARRHVLTLADLSTAESKSLIATVVEVERRWKLSSFAFAMRSGDIHFNGGSVEHLHGHVIVGDTDDPMHEPVRFKMSSVPKKDEAPQ